MAPPGTAAREVKERICGKRLVLFAPLYIGNLCVNECLYCAFRARNAALKRRVLSLSEIASEVKVLVRFPGDARNGKMVYRGGPGAVAGETTPDR